MVRQLNNGFAVQLKMSEMFIALNNKMIHDQNSRMDCRPSWREMLLLPLPSTQQVTQTPRSWKCSPENAASKSPYKRQVLVNDSKKLQLDLNIIVVADFFSNLVV